MSQKKKRCPWLNEKNPLYVDYHDYEWGRPVHDDRRHFEMLTLEGAQAGLSWEIILKKRANYRLCFEGFDPKKVARYSKVKIEHLMKDVGIVRNRLKIESTISNAKAFLEIQHHVGSFDQYIWGFVHQQSIQTCFKQLTDYPSRTALSDLISKDLKKRGFRFVGSTIIYAYMQAIGITNDHSKGCYLYQV